MIFFSLLEEEMEGGVKGKVKKDIDAFEGKPEEKKREEGILECQCCCWSIPTFATYFTIKINK